MAFYEDDLLTEFLDLDEFATLVTEVGSGSPENTFNAIFDSIYEQYSDGESIISTKDIQITARTVDVENFDQTTNLKIKNVTYRIRDFEPDGTGVTIVKLYLV